MKQIKLFSILMMLVLCCGTVFAQGITITGTITDAKTSESLPGASVVFLGATPVTGGWKIFHLCNTGRHTGDQLYRI